MERIPADSGRGSIEIVLIWFYLVNLQGDQESFSATILNVGFMTSVADYNVLRGAIPICLCLKHKTTGTERHYKSSAMLKKIDDSGHFETVFKPIPGDLGEWDLVSVMFEQ